MELEKADGDARQKGSMSLDILFYFRLAKRCEAREENASRRGDIGESKLDGTWMYIKGQQMGHQKFLILLQFCSISSGARTARAHDTDLIVFRFVGISAEFGSVDFLHLFTFLLRPRLPTSTMS